MWPTMIVLVAVLVLMAISVGATLVERLTTRRYFKVNVPKVVNAVNDAEFAELPGIVEELHVLKPQKEALRTVVWNMGLPDEDLYSLAKTETHRAQDKHSGAVKRAEVATKIAPMIGLMCTLIPLGPGIVAMGQGDVSTLSQSLLVAFDGTVAGLVIAIVANLIMTVRKRWYRQYEVVMDALMNALLQKANDAREQHLALPHGYSGEGSPKIPYEAVPTSTMQTERA